MPGDFELSLHTPSVATQAYQRLKEAIVLGYFKPGERLVERELVKKMNVSRTPIREALKALEKERLVQIIPYRGVFVRSFGMEEAEEIYQVRLRLEPLAARLAARNRTQDDVEALRGIVRASWEALQSGQHKALVFLNQEFHGRIARCSGNTTLEQMLETLRTPVDILRLQFWILDEERRRQSVAEHEAIANAIADQDEDKAEQTCAVHMENAWSAVRKGGMGRETSP